MSLAVSRRTGAYALILGGSLAIRISYGLHWGTAGALAYDPNWYHTVADGLADGHGFNIHCPLILSCAPRPSAYFPPLYPILLSVGSFLVPSHRLGAHVVISAGLGTVTVYLVGRLARRLFGVAAQLPAMVIAAVYPAFVMIDGSLFSESAALSLLTGSFLMAVTLARTGWNRPRAVGLGVLLGLAALAQAGSAFVLLGLVAYLLYSRWPPGSSVAGLVTVLCAFVLVIAPWTIYSTLRFHHLVVLANDNSTVAAGANCESTYSGELLGSWDYACLNTLRPGSDQLDEVEFGSIIRQEGLHYARTHVSRLPLVGAARLGRVWGVFHPIHADFGGRRGAGLGLVGHTSPWPSPPWPWAGSAGASDRPP